MAELLQKLLLGKKLKVYLRRDPQSGHIPEFIIGVVKFIDHRSGYMILKGGNKRYVFPNRSAIAYMEVED